MSVKPFVIAAITGQFLSLYPLVVLCVGVCGGGWSVSFSALIYITIAVFYGAGYFCGAFAKSRAFSRKVKPFAVFASRAAVVVPVLVFVSVCAIFKLSPGLYLYALPASVIAFFGGYGAFGKGYSDIFSSGWFILYFLTAIFSAVLLWFTHDDGIYSGGVLRLSVGFGVLVVLSAVLANQTNIDTLTLQRSKGMSVLPRGLRGYNAALTGIISAAAVGLFLFAKPLAGAVGEVLKALTRFIISLFKDPDEESLDTNEDFSHTGEYIQYDNGVNSLFVLVEALVIAALVMLAIRFRRQIWEFIKELFAPLFREREQPAALPFADEISDSDAKRSVRGRKSAEKELLKRYRGETDPALKYRTGYALFLMKLSGTPFAGVPSDTTDAHLIKGGRAFEGAELSDMIRVYDSIRYGEGVPTKEELSRQEEILWGLRTRKSD